MCSFQTGRQPYPEKRTEIVLHNEKPRVGTLIGMSKDHWLVQDLDVWLCSWCPNADGFGHDNYSYLPCDWIRNMYHSVIVCYPLTLTMSLKICTRFSFALLFLCPHVQPTWWVRLNYHFYYDAVCNSHPFYTVCLITSLSMMESTNIE